MKILMQAIVMTSAIFAAAHTSTVMAQDTTPVVQTLQSYEAALKKSDAKAIVGLFTKDGVLMPPDFPAAVGPDAIEGAYTGIFKAIKLNLKFTVDEVKFLGPNDALLRTHSDGTLTANGTDSGPTPSANKELFILRKDSAGDWKFTHYSFSEVKAN